MAISVGSVTVDVIPSTQGIQQKLKDALVPAATAAGKDAGEAAGQAFGPAMQSKVGEIGLSIGEQIGQQIANRIKAAISDALKDGVTDGGKKAVPSATKQGDQTGGAFARAMKARLEAAFKALPKVDVGADTSEVDADLQALRVRMETLSGQRIGIDVDTETARSEIDAIEAELRRLGSAHPNVAVRADAAAAMAQLEAVKAEIDRLSTAPGVIHLETDGTFGQRLRAQVEAAEKSLPNINITANTSEAEAELASLRSQLTALKDQRVGIDIDAETASAKVDDIRARLARLSASDADVAVRVDAAAAAAQLAQVQAMVSALNGESINIDAGPSAASVLVLSAALAGLSLIPAIPVLAAGLGSIAAAAAAAGVGVGALAAVAVPAIKQITNVLQLQKQAQDAATTSTASSGNAARQAAQKALQMASAEQALATAQRNASQQIQAARDNVVTAERGVQTAEQALAQAQGQEKQAQDALTEARKTAAEQLQDLNNQLVDSQLSQRDAALQVQEAQQNLTATQVAGSKATALQKQEAQLAYDQAVQQLKEQTTATQRLQEQTTAANKAGVTGSDTYKQAQDAVAQAQQNVADKSQGVKDAQAAVAKAQQQVAVAEQNAADSIASAQRQIQTAQLDTTASAATSVTAQQKYAKALAALSPAARTTLNAFLQLKTAFNAWSVSLQPQVMAIFTRALDGLRRSLPALTPFVMAAVRAISNLQDRVSQGLKTTWWTGFRDDLQKSVTPAIIGLGVAFGNVFVGMAGVIDAFLPHMNSISGSLQRITGRFADWGKGLKGSPAFEHFLAYASQQAPILGNMLGNVITALIHLGVALAPLSGTATSFINALANGLSAMPTGVLTVLGVAFGSLALGMKAGAIAAKLWSAAAGIATTVTKLLTAETLEFDAAEKANLIGLIVTALAALVIGLIYAYQHSETFRKIVQGAWAAIQVAVSYAWNTILKPAFAAIVVAFQAIATAATWLWQNVLSPVFSAIALGAKILLTAIVVIAILPIIAAVKLLGAIGSWLWKTALSPAFHGIGSAATWLWTKAINPVFGWIGSKATWLYNNAIKPAFNAIKTALSAVGSAAKTVWDKVLEPVFGWIGAKGQWLWKTALSPAFSEIKKGLSAVGSAFNTAKNAISKAWGQVEDIAKKPVKFIIDHVYNGGIVPTWNTVAKAFGAPQIKPYNTKGWATGGVLPGYTPGKDVHHFYSPTAGGLDLSGGEAIMRPEWTRAVGPGYVAAMNQIAASSGTPGVQQALGFAGGGIFGWIGKTLKGAGSAAWAGVKKTASWLKDSIEASARAGVKHVVDPLLSKIPGVSSSNFGKLIRKVPDHMLDSIFGYAKTADDKSVSTIGGKIPSGQHKSIISQALAAAHVPPPGSLNQWLAGMNTLIGRESGWNPRAINLTDINAKEGHPSQGLTQTIPSTWSHYVPASLRFKGILDPVGNVAASIRYIVSRYGNITKVQQANANLPPKGYDSGGYLQPGLNLAYNGTGRPEPVFTRAQANALVNQTTAATAGGLTPGQPLTLVVKDGPTLQAYVDGRADSRIGNNNAQILQAARARPRNR